MTALRRKREASPTAAVSEDCRHGWHESGDEDEGGGCPGLLDASDVRTGRCGCRCHADVRDPGRGGGW